MNDEKSIKKLKTKQGKNENENRSNLLKIVIKKH